METKTVDAKYIFMDIVNYSLNRTAEAQTEIIEILNDIVLKVLNDEGVNEKNRLLLPTGDGICIAIIHLVEPYDIHIDIGVDILMEVERYSKYVNDNMRKFGICIGINENTDNLITDINGHENIAGGGINLAQRIMNLGDEGHILVSDSVFTRLSQRDRYYQSFKSFKAKIKHNIEITIHQLLGEPFHDYYDVLNKDVPQYFANKISKEPPFPIYIAYYIGYLLKFEDFIKKNLISTSDDLLIFTMIEFLAHESVEKHKSSSFRQFKTDLPSESPNEILAHFKNVPSYFILNYFMFYDYCIKPYWYKKYFSLETYLLDISKDGVIKFFEEWPDIAKELQLKKEMIIL